MAFQLIDSEIDLKSIERQEEENPVLARLNTVKAKGIMNYVTLKENEPELQTLTFRHTTKAQERTRKRQQPIKLEPLPVLKVYQDHKQPEYIYEQNRRQLMSSGILKPSPSMLERPSFTTLEVQDSVKRKQLHRSSADVFAPVPSKLQRTGIGRRGLFGKRSSTYPKYVFHDREEVVKANIRDPLQIIKIIHENEHLGFLYMISAVPKSSIEYDTYNLK